MKKLTFLFPLFLLGFLTSCDVDTPEKAANYYDTIIKKTNPLITTYENDLIESFADFVPEEMEEKYDALETYVEKTAKELDELEAYHGDETLLNDAKALLAAYKKTLPLYKEKVEIESLSTANYTDAKADKSAELMDEIDDILNEANDKFRETTHKFGEEHNFPISKS